MQIPSPLRDSLSVQELSEEEISALAERLSFVDELGDRLVSIDKEYKESDDTLEELLEDIELDVSTNSRIPTKVKSSFSPWIIHTTWTLSIEESDASHDIIELADRCLNLSPIGLHADHESIIEWLRKSGSLLKDALVGFIESQSEGQAVIYLLLIDVVLSHLLNGIYRITFPKKIHFSRN